MDVIHSVKLLVYDLSNGMAANMSEAVLGQRIDGVWHTGEPPPPRPTIPYYK